MRFRKAATRFKRFNLSYYVSKIHVVLFGGTFSGCMCFTGVTLFSPSRMIDINSPQETSRLVRRLSPGGFCLSLNSQN